MIEPLLTATAPRLRVDGQFVGEPTLELHSLRVLERLDGLKTLELELSADDPSPNLRAEGPPEPRFLDGAVLDFGKRIEAVLGPESDPLTVFDGRISALEVDFEESHETHVRVLAEDELMALRWTRRMHSWRDASDAEIATAIAARHGLRVDADAPGPRWEAVQQWNMSDLAFLRERARLVRAELWVEQGTLHFKARGDRRAPAVTMTRGGDLLKLVVRADLAEQRSGVRMRGWDARRARPIDAWAPGSLIRDELGEASGSTGPELLERAFGRRSSARVREVPHDAEQARALAEAELRRRARGFVQVSGVSRGNARMIVGTRLTLEYAGTPFTGAGYYVTEVCHSFDREHGFRTRFEAERATLHGGSHA